VGRRPDPLEATVATIGARGFAAPCDVRDPDAVAGAFDAAEEALGPVTTLVNNAAGNFVVQAEDLSPNGWRAVLGIVLDGTFYCSRELGRRLIARGAPGQIVNLVATYAWTGGPGTVHSASAKAGVVALTRTLAVESTRPCARRCSPRSRSAVSGRPRRSPRRAPTSSPTTRGS
jgi:NAD(P)-dependent dehydrogenase (short-subunit alcohol dehydrogenase family)